MVKSDSGVIEALLVVFNPYIYDTIRLIINKNKFVTFKNNGTNTFHDKKDGVIYFLFIETKNEKNKAEIDKKACSKNRPRLF